jgi:starch-binding outer membrane protein, SusD/RagB family
MRYKIFSLPLIAIIAGIFLPACNKFLDVKPKGLDIVNSIDKYNGLFNNINLYTFINVRNVPGALATILGYPGAALMMSDDVFSSAAYLGTQPLFYQNAYQWKDDVFLPDDESSEWGTFYSQNYIYNVIANGVMDATDGTELEKKQLLAEARANRAYMHLMEVNYFAKPYSAATASTDPGVPIVVKADAGGEKYTRATVQQVYDFILSELQASIPDLPARTVNRARLAQTGGYYLLGLTYFWMGDYAKALPALNNCRNSLTSYTLPIALYNYNTTMAGWVTSGQPWLGANRHPAQTISTENIYLKQMSINWATGRNTVYLKNSIYSLYSTNDQRKKFFYNNSTSNAIPAPGLPGQQRNGPTTYNWGPNLADLHLMLAECKARAGDITGAKTDLETLRKARMPLAESNVTATTPDAMVKAVLDERLREFAGTGLRWFDMRRLSGDATYNNVEGTHPLDGTVYNLKPERLTLRIPPAILNLNPGMEDNK